MKHGIFLITVALLSAGGLRAAEPRQLLDRLRINHTAMVSSENDFHEQQRRGHLRGSEATDYAAYVARLHRLVAEDCAELVLAGVELPPELGCPVLSQALPVPAAIDQSAEKTLDEQLAVLDAELLGGLGDFDEMLLREHERIRAEAPMSNASASGGDAGSGDGGGGDGEGAAGDGSEPGSDAAGAEAASSEGAGDSSAGMGGRTQGSQGQRGGRRGGVPRDIPAGDDDDVVARQLREAAEKETSPELKEKLWEEYRKYKEGTR